LDPQRILLLVSGMTPQIVTETLYALCVKADSVWIPDEIHLITTGQGRNNAVLQLLEDKKRFYHFLSDYNISKPIRFDESTIHLIRDAQGKELMDLRTPQDNEAAADTITAAIRGFTQNQDSELHVSLAGGRKTMGFYAGYALSLFGRPQDCLSHVLVSEHYESHSDFYYPTPYRKEITLRDNRSLDASQAQVWLAKIPFVRLRSGLPQSLLTGNHGFSETVELARLATEKMQLRLWPSEGRFEVNGKAGHLTPVHTALLLWVIKYCQINGVPISPLVDYQLNKEYASALQQTANDYNVSLNLRTEESLKSGMTSTFLESNVSRLNESLRKNLGRQLAERCKLASRTYRGRTGYGLPEDVEIELMEDGSL